MKQLSFLFIALSAFMFFGSIIADKVFGIAPCELCLVQRYIWGSLLLISCIQKLYPKPFMNYLFLAILVISAGAALYHFSVQMEWLTSHCKADLRGSSMANFYDSLQKKSCKEVSWAIFGIPITLINFTISAAAAFIWAAYQKLEIFSFIRK